MRSLGRASEAGGDTSRPAARAGADAAAPSAAGALTLFTPPSEAELAAVDEMTVHAPVSSENESAGWTPISAREVMQMSEPTSSDARITPAEFHRAEGVSDWRVTTTGPQAVFAAASLTHAASLVASIVEASRHFDVDPDIDVRPEAIVVRVPDRDFGGIPLAAPAFAAAVSRAAGERGLRAQPARVQSIGIYVAQHSEVDARPFFQAALGYDPLQDTDAVDPLRCGPQLAFNPITGDAPRRGRTHLDVFVPADQARARVAAALAAGGRMVDDSQAPAWWSLASPDNHGVDIATWTDTAD